MDFFKFIENDTIKVNNNNNNNNNNNINNNNNNNNKTEINLDTNCFLKINDRVRIIHKNNSRYNVYKGYIGEIKKIFNNKYNITLIATSSEISIVVPRDHFIKLI